MGLIPKPKDPSGASSTTSKTPAPSKKGGLIPSGATPKKKKKKAAPVYKGPDGKVLAPGQFTFTDPVTGKQYTGTQKQSEYAKEKGVTPSKGKPGAPSYAAEQAQAWDMTGEAIRKVVRPVTDPVISSAGALLNTLNSGAAFTTGYLDKGLKDLQAGRIKDLPSYLDTLGKSLAAGEENMNAWKQGQYVKSNSDILIERFGMQPSFGTGLLGFAADVILDPINLIPFGAVGSVFRASAKSVTAGLDASKAVRLGEQSADVVARKKIDKLTKKKKDEIAQADEAAKAGATYKKPKKLLDTPAGRIEASGVKPGSVKYEQRQAPLQSRMMPGEASARFETRIGEIAGKYSYASTPMTKAQLANRSLAQKFADSVSFALEAGSKEFISTILTDSAIRSLNRSTRADIKKIWQPTLKNPLAVKKEIRTIISKEGNRFVVKSGNGYVFGRSKTKAGAEKIAAKAKKQQSASELEIATLQDYKQAVAPVVPSPADVAKQQELMNATVSSAIKVKTEGEAASVTKKILADLEKTVKEVDAISATGEAVKYNTFEDFVEGMRSGDNINEDSLKAVLAVMDPERKVVVEAIATEAATGSDMLNQVLVKDGVQTTSETAQRLEKASDPRELLVAEGIAYGDVLGNYVRALSDPGKMTDETQEAILGKLSSQNAAEAQTAQAAAIRWSDEEVYSARTRNLAENGLTRALEARNRRVDRIQQSDQYSRDYSTLGQQTEYSSELKLIDDSEAVSADTFDTIIEAEVLNSALAVNRATFVKNAERLEQAGKATYNPKSPVGDEKTIAKQHAAFADEQYQRIMEVSSATSDLLMSSGVRIANRKYMTDKDFVKAYKQFGEELRPKDIAYFNFVNIGDVFKTFKELGYDDLLKRSFIPFAAGETYKADTLLFMNLADATRAAMEMAEKGRKVNIKEIQTRLVSRYKTKKPYSAGFKNDMKIVVPQIAEALADSKVLDKLNAIHLERSVGLINDFAAKVETVSQDLADSMREMWTAKVLAGNVDTTTVELALRDSFRKFILAAKIFEIEGGTAVKALFRSYANVFFTGTKIDTPIKNLVDQEFEFFHREINHYFMSEKAANAAKLPEREGRAASKAVREKAQNKYMEQKTLYENHMKERIAAYTSNDLEVIGAWDVKLAKLQAGLDKARAAAYKKGVEVESFRNGEWVPMERFVREEEIAEAADQGLELPIDSEALEPVKRIAVSEKTQAQIVKVQRELHEGKVLDAAEDASKKLDNGTFSTAGDEIDQTIRAVEDFIATPLQQATRLTPVRLVAADYGTYKTYNYKMQLTEEQRAAAGITMRERAAAASAKWAGPGGPGRETTQYLRANEISAMNVSSDFAVYLSDLARKYKGISDDVMGQAWGAILRGAAPIGKNPVVQELYSDLNRIFSLVIGSPSRNEFVRNGIDLKDLIREASKFGFTPKNGFAAEYTGMSVADFFKSLPIGKTPVGLKRGTLDYAKWQNNRKVFKASELNEFETISALAHALQVVKLKKGLIEDFAVRQSYKFYGLSMDEALKAGFQQMKIVGGDQALSKYLPTPEDGGLFLPQAIDSFGATLREASAIYNREPSPYDNAIKTMMDVVGFVKSNQTVMVPGHQLTNMIGDTSIALNLGVVNPRWWGTAWRLSNAHSVERAAGDWGPMAALYRDPVTGQNGIDKLEAQWRNLFRQAGADELGTKGRKFEGSYAKVEKDKATNTWVVKNSRDEVVATAPSKQAADKLAEQRAEKTTGIVIYKNGKPTMVQFSDADLIDLMKRNGIIITNMFANDVQGLADYLDGATKSDSVGKFMRKAGAKLGLAYRRVEKVPGDLIAWHGNVPRIAHAMKVLQSRSWASINDAMAAASNRVLTYHPTVFSLKSSERRIGRAIFGYYTWIRVAHSAVLEMAMNQPALLTIPSKLQQNIAKAQGEEPESLGMPYSTRTNLPSYITKNVSPMQVGGEDVPYTIRLPFMQQSVFDTFNLEFDPSKTAEESFIYNVTRNIGGVLGKNINVVGNTLAELIFQVDPSTMTPTKIKDFRTFSDSLVSNFSVTQLLKGLGIFTPANKDDTSKYPITQEERDFAVINWLTRAGLYNPYTPANETRSRLEQRDRQGRLDEQNYQRFMERYNK